MKNLRFVLFSMAVLLLAAAAQAQQTPVVANVPFDFVVGNRAYPAGEYTLKSSFNDNTIVRIDNTQEIITGFSPSNSCAKANASKETKLVFHRMGNRYFLYQVWTAGNSTGREFLKSRAEIELAKNHEKSELVIVAANLYR
jgi:hypothetical protein